MGRTLSLTVVAQGVETKEQADFLRGNACDEFQGFYLNKPVPAEQIAELLRAEDGDGDGAARPPVTALTGSGGFRCRGGRAAHSASTTLTLPSTRFRSM